MRPGPRLTQFWPSWPAGAPGPVPSPPEVEIFYLKLPAQDLAERGLHPPGQDVSKTKVDMSALQAHSSPCGVARHSPQYNTSCR